MHSTGCIGLPFVQLVNAVGILMDARMPVPLGLLFTASGLKPATGSWVC